MYLFNWLLTCILYTILYQTDKCKNKKQTICRIQSLLIPSITSTSPSLPHFLLGLGNILLLPLLSSSFSKQLPTGVLDYEANDGISLLRNLQWLPLSFRINLKVFPSSTRLYGDLCHLFSVLQHCPDTIPLAHSLQPPWSSCSFPKMPTISQNISLQSPFSWSLCSEHSFHRYLHVTLFRSFFKCHFIGEVFSDHP